MSVNLEYPKILMLTWEYPPNLVGGLGRHVYWLANSLVNLNCHVQVVTAQTGGVRGMEVENGVKIHRVCPLHPQEQDFLLWIGGLNLAIVEHVLSLPDARDFDVIHTHDWLTGPAAITLAELLKLPLVATIHATEHGRNNGIYTKVQQFIHDQEQQLVQKTNRIIVCSEYMKEEVITVLGASNKKITVIPNGVEKIESDSKEIKDSLNLPIFKDKKMIFSMGRMVTEKGFDTLIEAAEILVQEVPNIYFVVAGQGPLLESLQLLVKEKGLSETVYFIGQINDSQRNYLLTNCDMAVFPSRYEPFGIAALEAMSSGAPVLLSETGGFKEIVEHGKTGLFMSPGRTYSLIEQLLLLLENPDMCKKLGEKGKTHVLSKYRWSNTAQKTKNVLNELEWSAVKNDS